jgi:UDP-N-acetylmuramoyl-tripeptide--D-alanyl-D-alanine ligase
MDLSISQILGAAHASLCQGSADTHVTGCSIDSRSVAAGDLFCAFPGERVDGNDYAVMAAQAGASCVAMTREPTDDEAASLADAGCSVLVIDGPDPDPEGFLLDVAGLWRSLHPAWIIVGVTGSVGKTTTKEMVASALATTYRVSATSGNYNSLIGVALSLLAADEDSQVVVLEMGMNHAGELRRQTLSARPALAVITNIGTAHIGFLGSRENIAHAKAEILEGLEAPESAPDVSPRLFMGGEDDFRPLIADELAAQRNVPVTLVGTASSDDVRAEGISIDDDGHASFSVIYPDGATERVALSVPGAHVIPDALFALAVADCLDCDRRRAAEAVAATKPYQMRLEERTAPGKPRMLDDSYNASPISVAGALDVLCSMACEGRRVAVLGEIGELGDQEERLHSLVGAYAAAKGLDLLVVIGRGPAASIVDAAKTMGMSPDRIEALPDVDSAVDVLVQILEPDDLVLVKASRAAGLDRLVQEVLDR